MGKDMHKQSRYRLGLPIPSTSNGFRKTESGCGNHGSGLLEHEHFPIDQLSATRSISNPVSQTTLTSQSGTMYGLSPSSLVLAPPYPFLPEPHRGLTEIRYGVNWIVSTARSCNPMYSRVRAFPAMPEHRDDIHQPRRRRRFERIGTYLGDDRVISRSQE
jgi:hypothetical protein